MAVVTSVVQPAVSAFGAAEGYSPAPSDQDNAAQRGVPHPPVTDTDVVPSMPAGAESANPFAEALDFYGFEGGGVTDDTPRAAPGAHGTAAMNSGTDWPDWKQPAGTRHQADTGGSARTYRELLPNAGIERGSNVRTMSTDNRSTRRPDGTLDSEANGHLANDISIRNVVPDLGTHGWIQSDDNRRVWNNVAVPAATRLNAPPGAFTPADVSPWLSVQPASVQTALPDVPDPQVNGQPAVPVDSAFNPYEEF